MRMKKMSLLSIVFLVVTAIAMTVPGATPAQAGETISTTMVDDGAFITVKMTGEGEVLSLYRIVNDRIILVDTVLNSTDRGSDRTKLPTRYMHRVDVEN
jgi:hypothetical protein